VIFSIETKSQRGNVIIEAEMAMYTSLVEIVGIRDVPLLLRISANSSAREVARKAALKQAGMKVKSGHFFRAAARFTPLFLPLTGRFQCLSPLF